MYKIKIIITIVMVLVLCGCSEYGEKRIVKLITVDKENVVIYYYDFSTEQISYKKHEQKNENLEKTLTNMLSENKYDLKLCRYAVAEKEIIENNIIDLFYALTNNRFSPDIVIIEGDTKNAEKYIDDVKYKYPLYNYQIKHNDKICAVIENAETETRNIIIDNDLYKTINREQSFVLDLLNGVLAEGQYIFEKDNKVLLAQIENANVFYFMKDNILNIKINANLKTYKGLPASDNDKKQFITYLKENLKTNAVLLLNDKYIADNLNLLWYKQLNNFNDLNIEVNIK